MRKFACVLIGSILFSSAWARESSSKIPSSNLNVRFRLAKDSSSNGVTCSAWMTKIDEQGHDSLQNLSIDGGDTLTCALGRESTTLVMGSYGEARGQRELPYDLQQKYVFTFTRFNGEVYTSEVSMPEQVLFLSPSAGTSFRSGEPIRFEWNNIAHQGSVMWSSFDSCRNPGVKEVRGSSFLEFPSGYTQSCSPNDYTLKIMIIGSQSSIPGIRGWAGGVTSDQVAVKLHN